MHVLPRIALVTFITGLSTTIQAEEWTGHASLLLGSKPIADSSWAKNDEHDAIAFLTDFRKQSWPISLSADLFGTGSERKSSGNKYETYTAEVHLGVRKVFEMPYGIQPYIGTGLALINASQKSEISGAKRDDEDHSTTGWIGVGSYLTINEKLTVGLDLRYVGGSVELNEFESNGNTRKIDVAGTMVGLSVGYQW